MSARTYIHVILPIKLGWEPLYAVESGENVEVGDRVAVPFAGRYALGVVSAVGVPLPEGMREESVRAIHGVNRSKARLLRSEIEFFRMVSQYYMCSVGEVYKAAYPMVKDETVRKRKSKGDSESEGSMSVELDARGSACYEALLKVMDDAGSPKAASPKTVLWDSCGDIGVMARLVLEGSRGGNVLWLVPEFKLGKSMEDFLRAIFGERLIIWGSTLTPARRRDATARVRGNQPYILLGTRSALFLPHHDLSLILVQDEHEASYKQSSPSPRYNGRDAAVMLGALHKARVVLESHTPSLESIYNCLSGKYLLADITDHASAGAMTGAAPGSGTQIVDIRAELRKRGMVGDISRKLIAEAEGRKCAVYKPRRAMFPKMEELVPQVESTLGAGCFVTDDLIERPLPADTEVLAVVGVDSMLGRADFRADEKVFQTIMQAEDMCRGSLRSLVIQTRESSHPVFEALISRSSAPLLAERREFGFPPFSRIVDICINDSFPDRAARMASALASRIASLGICSIVPGPSGLRIMLEKGRHLTSRKATLMSVVADFERESRYAGHIHFDVDPL